ncbi:MAG: ATP-binding protein [Pseudomonadota bacterium]
MTEIKSPSDWQAGSNTSQLPSDHEMLRQLFEMSALGFALTDINGRYVIFNEAFRAICGYSEEELRALDYWELTPTKYRDAEAAQLESLRQTGRYGPYQKEYIRKDGSLIPLRLNGVLMASSTGEQYIWSVVEDITKDKAFEAALMDAKLRAEAASDAKSNFLANVSHELRTPLNGVTALSSALLRTELNPRQREMAEIITRSSQTLESILSHILDLSRIEAGKIELARTPFDLLAELQLTADMVREKAEEKGVALHTRFDPALQGLFLGDAVRIKQVAMNLLSNAVKFTEQGSVTLSALAANGGGEHQGLILRVEDTGIGIDADKLSLLFERFSQADDTITRRFGGTGLGLAICQELAHLMGGEVTVQSRPGEGSRFEFHVALPRAAAPEKPVGLTPAGEFAHPRRVLLAEDHPVNRRVIELLLEPLGVDLATVENGAEAVEAWSYGGYDLILMDMQMPVMDGLSALRAIRAQEAERNLARTPAIMLTANSLDQHRELSLASGADLFLAKPVTPDKLYQAFADIAAQRANAA